MSAEPAVSLAEPAASLAHQAPHWHKGQCAFLLSSLYCGLLISYHGRCHVTVWVPKGDSSLDYTPLSYRK